MGKVGTIPRNGLVGEWKLDGNALDTSGSGNNGTATNVTYTGTDRGYQSQTGVFNGSNGYVNIPNSTAIQLVGNYTQSVWVYQNGAATNRIIQKDNSNDYSGGWALRLASGVFYSEHNYGVNTTWNSGVTIPTNVWTHILQTYDGANRTLYVNGVNSASVATTTNVVGEAGNNMFVGCYGDTGPLGQYYTGNIQGIRLYNRALIQQEIQSLYMEGMRKLSGSSLVPITDGLSAYYDFNGDGNDIVGGVVATLTGTPSQGTDRIGGNHCYVLNGSTQKISTGYSPSIGTSDFTVFAWYKTSTNAGNPNIISTNNGSNYIGVQIIGAVLYFEIFASNVQYSSTTPYNGNYHFVTATRVGSTMTLYFDGVSVASGSVSNSGGNSQLVFGGRPFDTNGLLNGTIDDGCGYMSRGISASEALSLYQISSQRYLTPLLF